MEFSDIDSDKFAVNFSISHDHIPVQKYYKELFQSSQSFKISLNDIDLCFCSFAPKLFLSKIEYLMLSLLFIINSISIFSSRQTYMSKGWLAIATLKPTFTFLVGILESKSIEYDKIPNKKSESWF